MRHRALWFLGSLAVFLGSIAGAILCELNGLLGCMLLFTILTIVAICGILITWIED